MSNSISSISSTGINPYASSQRPPRPDTERMTEDLFARLDVKGSGYIEQGTLESALGGKADDVMSALDGDSDGKISREEMRTGLQQLADSLSSQVHEARVARGMPPPPPPGGDEGVDAAQLKGMAEDASAEGNTAAASDLNALANGFDEADSNEDGKVSFQEAMAYKQAQQQEESDTTSVTASSDESQVLHRLMQLLHSYGSVASAGESSSEGLSVTA